MRAVVSLALAAASAASASRTALLRLSYSSSEIALVPRRLSARLRSLLRQFQMGLGLLASGLRLVQLRLVGPRVNHEQQVPGLHLRPVLEMDGVNVAGDPRPDFHHLDGLQVAGVFVPVGDRGELRLADRNLGGGRAAGLGGEQAVSTAAHRGSGADAFKH